MKVKGMHLSEDEINAVIIDDRDILDERRDHLDNCTECSNMKDGIEKRLHNLGKRAEELSPVMTKRIRHNLNAETVVPRLWRQALATSLVLALLTFGLWQMVDKKALPVNLEANLIAEMEEDNELLSEIYMLEERVLPELYARITGEPTGDDYDDLIDFISPETDEV